MCHRYLLDAPRTAAGVLSRLGERFPTRRENRRTAARTYLDTFDWRLYRDAGTVLSDAGDGSCSVRWDRFDGGLRHRATMPAPPDFARDLPPGGFRDELQVVTGIRRLLPVVRIERRSERISVVDGRDKAVVRLSLDHGTAAGSTRRRRRLPTILRLGRMTGYERAYRGVRRFVEERPRTGAGTGDGARSRTLRGRPPARRLHRQARAAPRSGRAHRPRREAHPRRAVGDDAGQRGRAPGGPRSRVPARLPGRGTADPFLPGPGQERLRRSRDAPLRRRVRLARPVDGAAPGPRRAPPQPAEATGPSCRRPPAAICPRWPTIWNTGDRPRTRSRWRGSTRPATGG